MARPLVNTEPTPYQAFAAIVLGPNDPGALYGAMQVAFRKGDEALDSADDMPDRLLLNKWYSDAVKAYQDFTEPREGES